MKRSSDDFLVAVSSKIGIGPVIYDDYTAEYVSGGINVRFMNNTNVYNSLSILRMANNEELCI